MKKPRKQNNLIAKKRLRKGLKRKRTWKRHNVPDTRFSFVTKVRHKYEKKVVENFKSKLFDFFVEKKFIIGTEYVNETIDIPSCFSLHDNYNKTMEIISDIVYSIWTRAGQTLEIDFSNCTSVDQSALFLLQIIRMELHSDFERLTRRLKTINTSIKMNVKKSNNRSVNKHLALCGFINPKNGDLEEEVMMLNSIGYYKGAKQQRSYLENRKGMLAMKIVTYLDECIKRIDFELNEYGKSDISNLIGEVLNNAEDHSPFTTYYITANYAENVEAKESDDTEIVGELHLSFMNFGFSIYEGLIENKVDNSGMIAQLEEMANALGTKGGFSEDNLFTLYALQDGVSRLKYKDQSRGTGTMKFINCFFSFGDYENTTRERNPKLSIISGKTHLICDNRYQPFEKENRFFVSLNDEKDFNYPPKHSHLKNLKYSFPGTLLSVKIFLNKNHISGKLNNDNNE